MYVTKLTRHNFIYQLLCERQAPPSQSSGVFSSVIVICSLGALTVTIQAKVRSASSPYKS